MKANIGSNDKGVDHSSKPLSIPVTAKDYRWYNLAVKTAALSDCRYKMGSVIVGKGGNVLSLGHNILRSHSAHADWPDWVVSIHSEHSAILRANCDIRGSTIYVARLGGNQISKPCPHCVECIKIAGIRTIVYSDGKDLVKVRATAI